MSALILAAAFGVAVHAAALGGPGAGLAAAVMPNAVFGRMPLITAPPVMRGLGKRDEALTVLVAPDNTCGYLDGRSSLSYACDKTASCAFITSKAVGAVACCSDSGCGFHVDCIESQDAAAGCDATCRSDTYTLKCTNGAAPYCGTVSFFNGIVDYFCNSAQLTAPIQAYTTYSGQAGRSFSPLTITGTGSSAAAGASRTAKGSASGASATNGATGSSSTAGSEQSGGDSNTNGGSGGGGGGGGTPIGPIIGGVVGGVAVLALIGLGVFFLIRQNNKKKAGAGNMPKWAVDQTGGPQQPPPPGYVPGPQLTSAAAYPVAAADAQKIPLINQYNAEVAASEHGSYGAPVSPPSTVTPFQPPPMPHSNLPPSNIHEAGSTPMQPAVYEAGSTPVQPAVYEAGGDAVGAPGGNANHRGQFHELS